MSSKLTVLLPSALVAATTFAFPADAQSVRETGLGNPSMLLAQMPSTSTQSWKSGQEGNDYVGLGESNDGAVLNGKYSITHNVVFRPDLFTNALNNNGDRGISVLAPITYDFHTQGNSHQAQALVPFVGIGPGITTGGGDSTNLQLVATTGADHKLGQRYTLDGAVNYIPFDESRTDFVAGLDYNF